MILNWCCESILKRWEEARDGTPGTEKQSIVPLPLRSWDTFSFMFIKLLWRSLRIQPFLLATRRWGRFARRNVCASATEITYWWRKICPESGQELWLVDIVVILFYLLFTNDRQKATKVNCKVKCIHRLLCALHWVCYRLKPEKSFPTP